MTSRAVGRIGERVLRRLKPFDCKELLYFDYQPLTPEKEKEIGCRRCTSLEEMLEQCDGKLNLLLPASSITE
jgi:formate dehydrogenase